MTTREMLKTINLTTYERLAAEARLARAEAMVELALRAVSAVRRFAASVAVGTAAFARRLRSPAARQAG